MKLLVTSLILISAVASQAKADAYEEKAAAAAERAAQTKAAKEHAQLYAALTKLNRQVMGKIPKNSTIEKCQTLSAYFGYQPQMSSYGSLPLEIGEDDNFAQNGQPPQIYSCHYHNNSTGKDCAVTGGELSNRGDSYSGVSTTCY